MYCGKRSIEPLKQFNRTYIGNLRDYFKFPSFPLSQRRLKGAFGVFLN